MRSNENNLIFFILIVKKIIFCFAYRAASTSDKLYAEMPGTCVNAGTDVVHQL